MLYTIMVRGLFLITTNFYDGFILATPLRLKDSAANSMEFVFMLTGCLYAKDGKKARTFSSVCKALGVQSDFCRSPDFLMFVANTEARKKEVGELIEAALASCKLSKPEALVLRGKLGFADSFVHGRLGSLVLKKLAEDAYGRTLKLDDDLMVCLRAMLLRLQCGGRTVSSKSWKCWHVFTDAAYEQNSQSGGLGAVLFSIARPMYAVGLALKLASHLR